MDIAGHAAVVTGGASGLGAATARMLAASRRQGGDLRREPEGRRRGGHRHQRHRGRLRRDRQRATEKAFAKAAADHGTARILINCAGVGPAKRIVGRDGPMPLDEFARVVSINLVGTFNAMRLAAAAMQSISPMQDGERGIIICTASVAAYEGQIGQAAYAASKGGVVGLILPAAREFAQFGIRVNAIAPGIFSTPDAARLAGGGAAEPRGCGAVSQIARPAAAICGAGSPHDREPLPQRRSDPPRRRVAHGAALMLTFTRTTRIEWGDCDPAGIIFYARYYDIFDVSTTMMLEHALGMNKIDYLKAYDFLGHPLAETRARFLRPTRFGDEVAIETAVVACSRSSFKIEHRLTKAGTLAVEGYETRVWVVRHPDDPRRMKSQPIPPTWSRG